jgi:hypothetical protein
MPRFKSILGGAFLSLSVVLALIALIAFGMPFLAVGANTYEGGAHAWGAFLLYFLFAVPATLLGGLAIALRGPRNARAVYVTVACLYGVPLVVFIAALFSMIFDGLRHKIGG